MITDKDILRAIKTWVGNVFLKKNGDASESTVTFEQAATRANVQPGDDLATAFAKLSKYCADLKPHAFNALTNNLLATVSGVSALDAAMGPVLKEPLDAVTELNELVNPSSKEEVLNFISSLKPKFEKSNAIPFYLQTDNGALGVNSGAYTGTLHSGESFNNVIRGELLNIYDTRRRLEIRCTLWSSPQKIEIEEFTDVPDLQEQITQINSDLSDVKHVRLTTQYVDHLETDENGTFYYDYVSQEILSTYPSAIAQCCNYQVHYFDTAKVLGTHKVDDNTIRIYFSENHNAAVLVSIMYKVKL